MGSDHRDAGPDRASSAVDPDNGGQSILARLREQRGILPRVLLRDEPSGSGNAFVKPLAHDEQDSQGDTGKYQFQGVVARGGVGVVHKGHDTDLGRDVALKLLHDRYRDQPEMTQRFVEEAQIGGQLQHPGIVPVYDLGMRGDRPFFTMRLIKGETLAALLEDRDDLARDRRRILSIFEHVCETMAYAHARGVIHRDLKPANIMVGSFGEVQVVDWGMGKVLVASDGDDEERPTASADLSVIATVRSQPGSVGSQSIVGSVMGTPGYMPPEQATGDVARMDERSDVFALGAILAVILTGEPPYPGDPTDALQSAARADLEPCRERLRACGADEDLVRLALDCLRAAPGTRPRNAAVLADRIATYLADLDDRDRRAELEAAEAEAEAASEHRRLEREQDRARWEQRAKLRTRVIAACLLLTVALGTAAYLWIEHDRAERRLRTTAAVRTATEEATLLLGQGRWSEARAAVERAREVQAAGEADEDELREVAHIGEQIESQERASLEEDQARRREAEVVDRLEEAFAASWTRNGPETDLAYRSAFLDVSVKADEEIDADVVDRLRAMRAAPMVAFFLEEWAWRRRTDSTTVGRPWRHLVDLSRAIDPDPTRLSIRSALQKGDRDAIRALVEQSDGEAPALTLATLGHALLRLGAAEDASGVLAPALLRHPSSSLVALLRADALQQLPDPDRKAISAALATARALRPESATVDRRLTRSLIALAGGGPEVERTLDVERPTDATALRRLASTLIQQGDMAGARDAALRIVELRENSAAAWVEHGRLLAEIFHDYPAAVAAYRTALRLDPGFVSAHVRLGDVYRRTGQLEDSVRAYEDARRIDASSLPALRGLIEAWGALDRFEEVTAAAEEAIELAPGDTDFRTWLAKAQADLGDTAAAVATLEAALALEPGHGHCRLVLAQVILFRDEPGLAESTLRTGLRQDGRNGLYHGELAECLLRQGRFMEALESARRSISLLQAQPAEQLLALNRVRIIEQLNALEPEVRAIVERREWAPEEASMDRAMVAHFLGQDLTAARMFEIVLERDPGDLVEKMDAGYQLLPVQSALRVATGRSRDALSLSADERHRWLRRARLWLRTDLDACLEALRTDDVAAREAARLRLRKWAASRELDCVRDESAQEALEPGEAGSWRKTWREVEDALERSRETR